jgi:hypothetical protein
MPSFLDQLIGRKPSVPDLTKLDLGQEAGKSIAANQANLPAAQNLVNQANLFSRDQITQMLQSTIPGYQGMADQSSKLIASELAGKIPDDVSGAVQDSAAARSLGSGTAGSGFSKNLVARDLGLTSLDLTQRGLSSMESWMKTQASLYEPAMINVGSMFISPAQQAGFDNEQNLQQFQQQWMTNQISAMPAMWAQDLKEAVEATLAAYGGASYSHAGAVPSSGGFGGGAAGEGGAAFSSGGNNFSTQFGGGGGNDFGGEMSTPGGYG